MTGEHSYEYVGKHRKPDPVGPTTDVLRATLALFTHPQQPLSTKHNRKEKH